MYGITSVAISREQEAVYRVSYEKWTTEPTEDGAAAEVPIVRGTYHEKRLYMRDTGRYWVISVIEDLGEEEIAD